MTLSLPDSLSTFPSQAGGASPKQHWQTKACQLHQRISADHFTLVVGLEGEFYLSHEASDEQCQVMLAQINDALESPIIQENGYRQFEYHITPRADVAELLAAHEHCLATIRRIAGDDALLTHKPYPDQPACGMHVHVHAEDAAGQRLYYKKDDAMSDELRHSLAGLMAHMEEAAALLFDTSSADRHLAPADHIATTISWGSNNRSTALRLPDSDPDQKRIEHRIAPADVMIEKLLAIIFASMLDGLNSKPNLPPPTYGNASDAQYGLQTLPADMSMAEATLSKAYRLRWLLA